MSRRVSLRGLVRSSVRPTVRPLKDAHRRWRPYTMYMLQSGKHPEMRTRDAHPSSAVSVTYLGVQSPFEFEHVRVLLGVDVVVREVDE